LTIKSAEPWLKQQKKQGWFVTASETVNKPAIQQLDATCPCIIAA
jgi:hypothetical protein